MSLGGVIGTAGHVDHGKTALTTALTGIDTDRLAEEKRRGITIELGFAHLALPSGRRVGVIDVPGHERYVRAMVGGAVGVDLAVMVIAADEGVMPQTREHLAICELLGIGRGVIALSKIDAVEPARRNEARARIEAALVGTFLARAPLVACSARSGEGLDDLKRVIEAALESPTPPTRWPKPLREPLALPRMPIDRVFVMKGFGSVVTGTLWSGSLNVGDEVELAPGGVVGRIRGLQVHGESVERATAGHRVAVNLTAPRAAITRGMSLGGSGELTSGRVFDVDLALLAHVERPLRRRARVLLHAGTRQVGAVVRLVGAEALTGGGRAFAEIETEEPLVLLPGDRFVLRGAVADPACGTTLGGGVVLRVLGRRGRRGARPTPELLEQNLHAAASGDAQACTRLELERAGAAGLTRLGLAQRVGFAVPAIDAAIETLVRQRIVEQERTTYRMAKEVPVVVAEVPKLDPLAERLHQLVMTAGLQPPRPVDAATTLGVPVRELERAIQALVRATRIARVGELYFDVAALTALRIRLVDYLREHGEITAQPWKELVGASRKFAIPLAEHFDAERLTLRVGDKRRLR